MVFPTSSFKNDLLKDLSIWLIDGERKERRRNNYLKLLRYSIKSSSTFIKITVSVSTLIKTRFSRAVETFFLTIFFFYLHVLIFTKSKFNLNDFIKIFRRINDFQYFVTRFILHAFQWNKIVIGKQ